MKNKNQNNEDAVAKRTFSLRQMLQYKNERNLTDSDLYRELVKICPADDLKPSHQMVRSWIRGERTPSTDYLPYLAYVLGCRTDDFFEGRVA